MPRIQLRREFPPSTEPIFISVSGWYAPVEVTTEQGRTVIRIRKGVLGVEDVALSTKLTWMPEKIRQLKEDKETRL